MLAILDYKAGNQTSVQRALNRLDIASEITSDPERLMNAHGVIFPGVGAAAQAMGHLVSTGLDQVLRDLVAKQRPLLGICLGCQILLEKSEESDTTTLGILPGNCRKFDPRWTDLGQPVRIPHMGWNSLLFTPDPGNPALGILNGIEPGSQFYFVHSYYTEPPEALRIASTVYGTEFTSVYGRPGLWAAQFHPEKSGKPGLRLLENFAAYCEEQKRQPSGANL